VQTRIVQDISQELLTLDQVKEYARIHHNLETNTIELLIKAVRQLSEKYTGLSFAEKTIECYVDASELKRNKNTIELPGGPHIEVIEVTKQASGQSLILEPNTYSLTGFQYLSFSPHPTWSTYSERDVAYKIQFTAGFGHEKTQDLDDLIKVAMALGIVELYENRQNTAMGTGAFVNELPFNTKHLLSPYRRRVWI
jgi:uncharacterized phiE125 gp8 family phage protein